MRRWCVAILMLIPLILFAREGMAGDLVRERLGNGMKVVLWEEHKSPVCAFQVWVEVGSADETEDEIGISHLVEHMIFKGSDRHRVGEIAGAIEALGGEINAYTSYDYTVFHVQIASRYWEEGLAVLVDALLHPRFDTEELEREKQVVLEEIKGNEDDPWDRLYRALFRGGFQRHPYGRPIIGYEHTVKRISRRMLLRHYRRWYQPRNMVFVGVGDFAAKRLLELVKGYFLLPGHPLPERRRVAEPPQKELRLHILKDQVKERYFAMGFPIPSISSRDEAPLRLLAICLGGGRSSRLDRSLRIKEGLVSDISVSAFTPKDPGLFIIDGAFQPGCIEKGLSRIAEEIARVKKEGVTEEELRKAKTIMEASLVYNRENARGRGSNLGYWEVLRGGADKEGEYLIELSRVTVADIKKVAQRYLRLDGVTLCLLCPEVEKVDETLLRRNLAPLAAAQMEQEGGGLKRILLDNGVTLVFREDHSLPVVGICATFLGGMRFEQAEKAGLTSFLAEMLMRGTKRHSASALADEVEGMGARLWAYPGMNSFGVQAKGRSPDFARLMELVAEVITMPSFPPAEVVKVRGERLAVIRMQQDDSASLAMKLLRETLYEKHPYRLSNIGTEETIKRITRRDLVRYHRRYAVAENLVIAVVGDLQWERVQEVANKALAGMRRRKFSPPPIPEEAADKVVKKREEVVMGREQVHIAIGFLGTTIYDNDRYPLEVLEAALDRQGGRFFRELRDRKGLAYATSFFSVLGLERGYIGAYIATSPSKEEEAVAAIMGILKEVRERGISQKELQEAKAYIIGNHAISLQSYLSLASDIAPDERYGLGADFYQRYPNLIEGVTSEDVLRVARRYLLLDACAIVTVRPKP